MKTSELTGAALDWAVSKALGEYRPVSVPNYSTDWSQGGPIIEGEKIDVLYEHDLRWVAVPQKGIESYGPTPLVAAMRCYVTSKLGDEIELPTELGESK